MKKVKLMMMTLMMCLTTTIFMVSCENRNHTKSDKLSDIELQMKAEHMADSLINDAINKSNKPKNTVSLDSMKKSIQIIKYYTSEPNSADGVDCNIIWKNLSKKTIKYATFTVIPYNAVNDAVKGRYDSYSDGSHNLSVTGPIKTNQISGYGTYWECIWYNSTIDYMRIVGIELEYMDGSKLSTSDTDIINKLGYYRQQNN